MKHMSRNLLWGIICIGLIFPAFALADSVTPETFSALIEKGGSVSVKRTVCITKEVTSAKADVFFLFDTTGSMGELLVSTQAKAAQILSNASKLGDVAFGVGYYEDFPTYEGHEYGYPGDVPYEMLMDITKNSSAVKDAINSLLLGHGDDVPESNLYALSQTASSASWREGAARIIVWFGDAVGHDGDIDPHYPSRVGLQDVITDLTSQDIIVEAVNVGGFTYEGYWYNLNKGGYFWPKLSGQATAIASATGGGVLDGSNTSAIVTTINNALQDAFAEYSEVRLELSDEFSGLGVSISPAKITGNFDRSRERCFEFNSTYTGIETGIYNFDLLAQLDGGTVALASDHIEVSYKDCNGDWKGSASVDDCGDCVGGNTGKAACIQDCNGEWGGTAVTDACGDCVGGNTGKTACGQDCNNEWGGAAVTDACGDCVGGSTGKTACVQDCNEEWGGTAVTDNCGECVGGNTGKTACVQDCNGEWDGTAVTDNCGDCVGGNTGKTACVQDCNEEWGGTAFTDDCGDCVGGSTGAEACVPSFTGGTFVVGPEGTIQTDWLYDGGMYRGELGIFSLHDMEDPLPDMTAFIAEAVARVLSDSEKGHVVLSDRTEGARFSGPLGGEAKDWNKGPYEGVKSFAMTPGDRIATILVPNSTFERLREYPGITDAHVRPLFSLVSSNPAYGMYLGQVADVNGMGKAFVYEDMSVAASDRDYNDLIIQITGATINEVPTLDVVVPESSERSRSKRDDPRWSDWRTGTELGRQIMEHICTDSEMIQHIEPLPGNGVQIAAELDASSDLLIYDPLDRLVGRDGGYIPGALFGTDADGTRFIILPVSEDGTYRLVIRGTENETGVLTIRMLSKDKSILSEEIRSLDIRAHRTLKSDLSVSSSADGARIDISDVSESPAGPYDINGDDIVDAADINMVSSQWNVCDGNEGYDMFFDFDEDGCITILDIMQLVNSR